MPWPRSAGTDDGVTGFSVSPDSFAPVAGQLHDIAGQLDTAWEPVKSQTQAVRFGRGDDPVSPLIQVSLQAAVQLVDSSITSSSRSLHSYAAGLQRMGSTYHETEHATTQMMNGQRG